MEGASNGSTERPENDVPEEVQFVLNWNPPRLIAGLEADRNRDLLPNTARPSVTPGYSRPAAFYDRHLASHLILEHVVCLDTLVSAMARTVDKAIEDAVNKGSLPKDKGLLLPARVIERLVGSSNRKPYHELGVAEIYGRQTAEYCRPIVSTLAVHPSSRTWGRVLDWTVDQKDARWAIAEGALRVLAQVAENNPRMQQLLENEDADTKDTIKQLALDGTALAIWEMKNLTVGTAEVMENIVEMGEANTEFSWKKCATPNCNHRYLAVMEESKNEYDAGFDPRSPPWTLPRAIVPSTSAVANSQLNPMPHHLRSASALGGETSRPSYQESSMSSVEDGERVGNKRHINRPDDSKDKRPLKKSKDFMGASYEPEPPLGAREEDDAQLFLQQTWAQAVRNKCTIVVLHSGNHEIIGIRHRKSQTLYISRLIEPHSCSNPAYGKIQVGIYIAAIQETIDRARQDEEARKKLSPSRDPSADVSLRNEEANLDEDPKDHSLEEPTTSNKWSLRSGRGKQRSKQEGNAKRPGNGKEIDDQVLLANAARQDYLCLHFFYDIYDSPHPATFRRVLKPKEAVAPAKIPTSPSSGHEKTLPSASFVHITLHSELQPGSTGIVHIGTMAVDQSGPTTEVAVKIAFLRDEKSRLMEEHRIYSYLHSKGVQGIPRNIGLFVDQELLLGAEGPYALVMSYAGRSMPTSDSHNESLLATLTSMHRADVLHGDLRHSNICVTAAGEASLVDFSHATKGGSQKEKDLEIQELAYILKMDLPMEPAARGREARARSSSTQA